MFWREGNGDVTLPIPAHKRLIRLEDIAELVEAGAHD
jgi:hypothetical protein